MKYTVNSNKEYTPLHYVVELNPLCGFKSLLV